MFVRPLEGTARLRLALETAQSVLRSIGAGLARDRRGEGIRERKGIGCDRQVPNEGVYEARFRRTLDHDDLRCVTSHRGRRKIRTRTEGRSSVSKVASPALTSTSVARSRMPASSSRMAREASSAESEIARASARTRGVADA